MSKTMTELHSRLALVAVVLCLYASPIAAQSAGDSSDLICPTHVTERMESKTLIVIGDSVEWGQGLAVPNKFWCKVRQELERMTGNHVEPYIYAHAGAVINPDTADPWERDYHEGRSYERNIGHEVNLSFPSIRTQVADAYTDHGDRVDYVLVDGCINDVNKTNIMSMKLGVGHLRTLVRQSCGTDMRDLLFSIGDRFPTAKVIVTGYFPLVFAGFPPGAKGDDVIEKGTAKNVATSYIVKTVTSEVIPDRCKSDVRACLGPMSRAWLQESDAQLASATDAANSRFPGRFQFVQINMPERYAFSTPQSELWTLNLQDTGLGGLKKVFEVGFHLKHSIQPNDQMVRTRKGQCEAALQIFKRAQMPDDSGFTVFSCSRGSLAHPNIEGASRYTEAIKKILRAWLPPTHRTP